MHSFMSCSLVLHTLISYPVCSTVGSLVAKTIYIYIYNIFLYFSGNDSRLLDIFDEKAHPLSVRSLCNHYCWIVEIQDKVLIT